MLQTIFYTYTYLTERGKEGERERGREGDSRDERTIAAQRWRKDVIC